MKCIHAILKAIKNACIEYPWNRLIRINEWYMRNILVSLELFCVFRKKTYTAQSADDEGVFFFFSS